MSRRPHIPKRLAVLGSIATVALASCRSGVGVKCGDAVPEREVVLLVSRQAAGTPNSIPLAALAAPAGDSAALRVDVTTPNANGSCSATEGGVQVDLTAADLSKTQLRLGASVPVTVRALQPGGAELARTTFEPAGATHPPLTWH